MFTMRTLREGRWPLAVLAVLSLAGLFWCSAAAAISLALLAFTVAFFRDPRRVATVNASLIVAPADGRVVEITRAAEPHFLRGNAKMVAIFLSVFDVHVQRAPLAGEIKLVRYQPGKFLDARNPQAGALNESRLVGIESADGFRVTVRQIAGKIARRVVGWSGEGARVARGERIGMIRFGSRVELYLPATVEIAVAIGDAVKGGETIIARRP